MHEHHRWAWFAILGIGYTLSGVALTVQEVTGPLTVRWDIVLPALLVAVGLLVAGSAAIAGRRRIER